MNYKVISIVIAALAIGLISGYLLFGNRGPAVNSSAVSDQAESKNEIWTCSMHPQIRQDEPGQCPLCGMDLIPVGEVSSSVDPLVFEMTEDAVQLSNIQTTIIGASQSGESQIKLNGRIKADETRSASIVSHIPGRIEKLFISFTGENVNRGQKIATVYSPELITAQRELIEANKISDISPSLVEAAKNKLKYWKIPESTIQEVLDAGTVREHFDVYADHSGVVMQRKVSVGDYLRTGEVLFDVQNLNRLWVLFDVYEEELSSMKIGDKITFTTTSFPGRTFSGRVSFIDPVINPATRVATIRVEVANESQQLKPDMFVTGTLARPIHGSENITIPKTALLWTGERSVVYVKKEGTEIPSFEYREITLGSPLGNSYIVENGLSLGEEVVTNGAFVIDAASQLNNRISMMNKNVMLKGSDHSDHLPDYTQSTPDEFKQQLESLVENYIVLKDALVKSGLDEAGTAAVLFLENVSEVDMSLVQGDAHIFWMEQSNAFQSHGELIYTSNELEEQRKQFDHLSAALIKTIKSFGITSDTLYVQHCPMAIQDKGADWISFNDNILNPYFGEKMLTCGLNTDTITIDYRNPPMEVVSTPQQQGHNH